MPSRAEDPAAYAAQRAYWKRRAIVKKLASKDSLLSTPEMTNEQLAYAAMRRALSIEAAAKQSSDPQLYSDARDLIKILVEMELRGDQLTLDLSHVDAEPRYGDDSA